MAHREEREGLDEKALDWVGVVSAGFEGSLAPSRILGRKGQGRVGHIGERPAGV